VDKTNRYKTPQKQSQYEHALKTTAKLSDALLWSPAASLAVLGPRDVVAKAIRVIRGRRR
jgi:hypothetical protein